MEEGEALEDNNESDDDSSDEEVQMPVKKKPILTPRKSIRLALKDKRPIVLDDDSTKPPSPKPATPPSHHIPSPPPSPIPATPPPITT